MTEKFEDSGYWFLPQNTEITIAGIITFIPNNKISLNLFGSFFKVDPIIEFFSEREKIEVIHGITSNGKKITLFNCYPSINLHSNALHPTIIYDCKYCILDFFLTSLNDRKFHSISFSLPALNNWLPPRLINKSIIFKNEKIIEHKITYGINDFFNLTESIDKETNIIFTNEVNSNKNNDVDEISLTQTTLCEIKTNGEKLSFLQLVDKAIHFKKFLNFASLNSGTFLKITLQNNDYYQEIANGNRIYFPIDLFYIDREINNINPTYKYLFKHVDIKDEFRDILIKWYSLGQRISPIRDHLLNSLKEKIEWSSIDFLTIVQALEGYHTRFIDSSRITLNNRIQNLIQIYSDIHKVEFSEKEIKQTVSSRNYYSHFFEKTPDILDGKALFDLTNKLKTLLICCFLSLIGLNNDKINSLLNKDN